MSIGIYLSFPFSKRPAKDLEWGVNLYRDKTVQTYLNSLFQEIQLSTVVSKRKISSVLFGAGDWSLVSLDWLNKIIAALKNKFCFSHNHEFTLEIDRPNLSYEKLVALKKMGVNRLSINVFDASLNQLARLASAMNRAKVNNFNLDLHFGKPGQTMIQWQKLLKNLLLLNPPHLSLYSFGSGRSNTFLKEKMYLYTLDLLSAEGYRQYEICHSCRPGFECRQNLIYWQRISYLGFGLRASTLWESTLLQNASALSQYARLIAQKGSAVANKEKLSQEQQKREEIYFALRQTTGLDLKKFKKKYGQEFGGGKESLIGELIKKGYLLRSQNRLRLTKEGYLRADEIIERLILR